MADGNNCLYMCALQLALVTGVRTHLVHVLENATVAWVHETTAVRSLSSFIDPPLLIEHEGQELLYSSHLTLQPDSVWVCKLYPRPWPLYVTSSSQTRIMPNVMKIQSEFLSCSSAGSSSNHLHKNPQVFVFFWAQDTLTLYTPHFWKS